MPQEPQNTGTFDYVIVGAGSAGCALAARLSENPDITVLVLEAGGPDSNPFIKMPLGFLKTIFDPRLSWGYMGEPEPHLAGRRLWLPRGKVVGGSSSINGMFYMRGHPADYDGWARMGCTGWSYADVLPYFKRMEDSWRGDDRYHATGGPLSVVPIDGKYVLHEPLRQSVLDAGYPDTSDVNGEFPEGPALGEVTVDRRGRRASAAAAYLRPALKRPNLELRVNCLARKVLFDGTRAQGVAYSQGADLNCVTARREIILCGGAYNSPHLLMLSGIGDAEQLKQHGIEPLVHLPGVGRNLSEHPNVMLEFSASAPVTFVNQLRFDRAVLNAARWFAFGTGPFATQVNSCNIILRTLEGLAQPDIQLMANPVSLDARLWFPGVTRAPRHTFSCGVVALQQHSRGWLNLRSADPRDLVAVTLNLLDDPEDLAVLRRGIRVARKIYGTGPQAALVAGELSPGEQAQSDEELDAWIRETVVIGQHAVGSCTMGTGAGAVVDPQLNVVGVQGLRIADASIMPTIPGANTNATAIMIGEKAADLVQGRQLAPAF